MQNQKTFLKQQILFWAVTAITVMALVGVLREILLPFITALAIAYFLDPLADRLERLGLGRLWATIVIMLFFSILFVGLLIVVMPWLINELMKFVAKLPDYVKVLKNLAIDYHQQFFGHISEESRQMVEKLFADMTQQATTWAATHLSSLVSGGLAFFNFLALLLITPVVTFYLLKDWKLMISVVDHNLPQEHGQTIRQLAAKIDNVMAGFIRGQITVLLILGTFYAVALQILGLNFGLLIGVFSGLISFIPFVGSITGGLIALIVAMVQYGSDWFQIALVMAVFLVGQALEGNFLSPQIIGDRVRLHPVWLILSLFVFGYLLGFVGLIIAVPVAAAIGVLVRFAFEKYRESEIYRGADSEEKANP